MRDVMKETSKESGLTLLEALITIAILSILAALTLPSYHDLQLKLLHSANANNIEDFLQQARQKAIYLKQDIYVSINPVSVCLGASFNPQCDCSLNSSCQVNNVNLTLHIDKNTFSLAQFAYAQSNHFRFDGNLGLAAGNNGSFVLSSPVAKIKLIVSALGRTRTCLIEGNIAGVPTC